jgi:hypothetical protein
MDGSDFRAHRASAGSAPRGETPDPAARLRETLAAVASGAGSRDELQRAAGAVVAHLRRENLPPEQMLLQIKEILTGAGLRPTYATEEVGGATASPTSTLYRDVIAWSIRRYYDGTA